MTVYEQLISRKQKAEKMLKKNKGKDISLEIFWKNVVRGLERKLDKLTIGEAERLV